METRNILQEFYALKKQFEHILSGLNPSPYFSAEQKQLTNDSLVVLACISDSDDNIAENDRMIIELLMPIQIENGNQTIYKQIRGFIMPEQLKYYEVSILKTIRERNKDAVLGECISYFENLGNIYFKISGMSPEKKRYFDDFILALKGNTDR